MGLLSMTDCAVADNRVQARYELDAAYMAGSFHAYAEWAKKWGRSLLDYADDAPSEDDVSHEVAAVEAELIMVRDARDGYYDALEKAIRELDKIDTDDCIRNIIDTIISDLENSL